MLSGSLFIIVLVFMLLPFSFVLRMCGFDWLECVLFSLFGIGLITSFMWLIGSNMLLTRAFIYAMLFFYGLAFCIRYYKKVGGAFASM